MCILKKIAILVLMVTGVCKKNKVYGVDYYTENIDLLETPPQREEVFYGNFLGISGGYGLGYNSFIYSSGVDVLLPTKNYFLGQGALISINYAYKLLTDNDLFCGGELHLGYDFTKINADFTKFNLQINSGPYVDLCGFAGPKIGNFSVGICVFLSFKKTGFNYVLDQLARVDTYEILTDFKMGLFAFYALNNKIGVNLKINSSVFKTEYNKKSDPKAKLYAFCAFATAGVEYKL